MMPRPFTRPPRPTAVLAEDEPMLLAELRERLATLWPELQVLALAEDGAQALAALQAHPPDVLFLDIEMPCMNGLDVAAAASGRCHVVFVTAYGHYAVEAFDRGAVDYLLKPIVPARLAQAVDRVRRRLHGPPPSLDTLLQQLANSGLHQRQHLRWITVAQGRNLRLLTCDEVHYFQADNKYTRVVAAHTEALITRTIRQLVGELDPASFLQIHRGTVVNLGAIDRIDRDLRGNLAVRLRDRPERLPVSASFAHAFRSF